MATDERVPLLSVESGLQPRAAGGVEVTGGSARFNLLFLKRFCRLVRVIFPRLCSTSLLYFIFFVFCRAAAEYNYYSAGLIPSYFFSALDDKNVAAFKVALWQSTVIVFAKVLLKCFQYFKNINYYLLNVIDHGIDNPDQRITQDVDRWCKELTDKVLMNIILSPFVIAYYTYRTYQSMGYIGPLTIYGSFLVSTVINKFIMGPIVGLIVKQEKQEGNFRFHHVQVRSSAESLAFYQAGRLEGEKANRLLQVLLRTQRSVVHWQFLLNFSVNIFDYVSSIISYSLVGMAIFSGKYDDLSIPDLSAVISKNAFISMYLLNNFSTLVDTATYFTDIAGYTHRIGQFLEALSEQDEVDKQREGERRSQLGKEGKGEDTGVSDGRTSINTDARSSVGPVCIEKAAVAMDLSISPPGQLDPLIEGVNLEFKKGKNILILGDSGCGKSSLLRVFRGLWPPLHGQAGLCCDGSHHCVMFLPQRPYLTSGSLADQVPFLASFPDYRMQLASFPATWNPIPHGLGMRLLFPRNPSQCRTLAPIKVSLCNRLGGVREELNENWYDAVSPGEMQKIAFARLFFHRPPFAFLDEATCALSEESEDHFYTVLSQLGITVMSVGHRSSLRKYHLWMLMLYSNGSWQLTTNGNDTL